MLLFSLSVLRSLRKPRHDNTPSVHETLSPPRTVKRFKLHPASRIRGMDKFIVARIKPCMQAVRGITGAKNNNVTGSQIISSNFLPYFRL